MHFSPKLGPKADLAGATPEMRTRALRRNKRLRPGSGGRPVGRAASGNVASEGPASGVVFRGSFPPTWAR